MKCLSMTQPWASLVALGAKRVETRSWPTSYRGPLAIHAAKAFPPEAQWLITKDPFLAALWPLRRRGTSVLSTEDLPRGVVVATCHLVDVIRVAPSGHLNKPLLLSAPELAFGDFSPGRYVWVLSDVQALEEPIPARGSLGLWNWSPERERVL